MTTSTYVVAWPQGISFWVGTCDTRGHGPPAHWLSLPFCTPEGAWPLSPLAPAAISRWFFATGPAGSRKSLLLPPPLLVVVLLCSRLRCSARGEHPATQAAHAAPLLIHLFRCTATIFAAAIISLPPSGPSLPQRHRPLPGGGRNLVPRFPASASKLSSWHLRYGTTFF